MTLPLGVELLSQICPTYLSARKGLIWISFQWLIVKSYGVDILLFFLQGRITTLISASRGFIVHLSSRKGFWAKKVDSKKEGSLWATFQTFRIFWPIWVWGSPARDMAAQAILNWSKKANSKQKALGGGFLRNNDFSGETKNCLET